MRRLDVVDGRSDSKPYGLGRTNARILLNECGREMMRLILLWE